VLVTFYSVIKKGKKDSYQLRPVVDVAEVVENAGN
jgi:hypothetical protein